MIKIKEELKSFVRPSPHSKYSPSAAERWMGCPASIQLSEGIPEETSSYAQEGTIAHEFCEHIYRERMYGVPIPMEFNLQLSQLPDTGVEMEDHAHTYVDLIEKWLALKDEIGEVIWYGVERGIPVFPEKGCFGTGDFVIVGTKGAAIIDFKYGKGKDVPATSSQLKVYALGVYRHVENIPEDYEWNVVIFQPRTHALPKCHTYSNQEMKDFEQEVYQAILESEKSGLVPVINSSHCHWCPAKRTRNPELKCPAQKQRQIDVATKDFDSFLTDIETGGKSKRDEALVRLVSLFPLIKSVVDEANDEFQYRLEKGEQIDGVRLIDKVGRRTWKLKDDVDSMAKEITEKFPNITRDQIIESKEKVIAISKVKKLLGKEDRAKLEATMTVVPSSKTVEVLDEKRNKVLEDISSFNLIK